MKRLAAVAAVLVALGVGGYVWFSTQFVTRTVRGMDWPQVDAETIDPALIADTGAGRVAGSRHPAGPVQFRSIPFAKAPAGGLRWAAPRPAESWSGALDARRPAPRCLQPMSFAGKWPGGQSEDCLWLSVWTPAVDDEARPVVVFSVPSRLVEDPLPWLSDFSALFEESLTKQEAAPTNDTKGVGRHGLLAF